MLKGIKGQKSKFAIPEKFACDIQGVCVFKNPGGSTVHVEKPRGFLVELGVFVVEKVKSRGSKAKTATSRRVSLKSRGGCQKINKKFRGLTFLSGIAQFEHSNGLNSISPSKKRAWFFSDGESSD